MPTLHCRVPPVLQPLSQKGRRKDQTRTGRERPPGVHARGATSLTLSSGRHSECGLPGKGPACVTSSELFQMLPRKVQDGAPCLSLLHNKHCRREVSLYKSWGHWEHWIFILVLCTLREIISFHHIQLLTLYMVTCQFLVALVQNIFLYLCVSGSMGLRWYMGRQTWSGVFPA